MECVKRYPSPFGAVIWEEVQDPKHWPAPAVFCVALMLFERVRPLAETRECDTGE